MEVWVQIVIGAATAAAAAGLAYLGAIAGAKATREAADTAAKAQQEAIEQREIAARREEWWRRFTWAVELLHGDSDGADWIGLEVLVMLADSELAGTDEIALITRLNENELLPELVAVQAATDEIGEPELYVDSKEEDDDGG